MKIYAVLIGVCLAFGGAHATERRGGSEADYAAIQAFHDRSIEKFNAGDLEGSVDDYLPQLRVLHTKATKITGREELRASMAKSFAAGKPILLSEIAEMEVQGSGPGAWAYITCRFAAADRSKPDAPIGDGRYIALLKRTDAGWKVLLDIDNGADGAAPDLVAKLKAQLAK